MAVRYLKFAVNGQANTEVWDKGITSTEAEPKKILSVLVAVSDYQDNTFLAGIEREEILSAPDYILDTWSTTGTTNTPRSTTKRQEFRLDHTLEVGKTFAVGILCGATATNLRGVYVYEIP